MSGEFPSRAERIRSGFYGRVLSGELGECPACKSRSPYHDALLMKPREQIPAEKRCTDRWHFIVADGEAERAWGDPEPVSESERQRIAVRKPSLDEAEAPPATSGEMSREREAFKAACEHGGFVDAEETERVCRWAFSALAAAEARAEKAERTVESTQEWYGVRAKRLQDLALVHGIENEVASILANGTAEATEPPTYAQMLNLTKYRAKRAEQALREIAALPTCEWSEQAVRDVKAIIRAALPEPAPRDEQ